MTKWERDCPGGLEKAKTTVQVSISWVPARTRRSKVLGSVELWVIRERFGSQNDARSRSGDTFSFKMRSDWAMIFVSFRLFSFLSLSLVISLSLLFFFFSFSFLFFSFLFLLCLSFPFILAVYVVSNSKGFNGLGKKRSEAKIDKKCKKDIGRWKQETGN